MLVHVLDKCDSITTSWKRTIIAIICICKHVHKLYLKSQQAKEQFGSKNGAVRRELASHQCLLGLNPRYVGRVCRSPNAPDISLCSMQVFLHLQKYHQYIHIFSFCTLFPSSIIMTSDDAYSYISDSHACHKTTN